LKGEPLFREHGKQVAALCWRSKPMFEVLLITSLSSRRWILPKGWPMDGLTLAQSAAREAYEEAGVSGEIADASLGSYHYLKERKDHGAMPCSVSVFALAVQSQARTWPEKGARELAWLPIEQAAARVAEPGLRHLLLDFHKLRAQQRRAG
jgi:8-oxo-dGTP pyrophosphatase MutT (NUDIX family)